MVLILSIPIIKVESGIKKKKKIKNGENLALFMEIQIDGGNPFWIHY